MSVQPDKKQTDRIHSKINRIPYVMDRWKQLLTDSPSSLLCVDGLNMKGYTIAEADLLSGRIYGYLKSRGIGTEDTVMICLPRGVLPVIAVLGVLKAGAAFTIVENNCPPERIEFIKNDFECRLVMDMTNWCEVCACDYLEGYEKTEEHDLAFGVYTSGSTGTPKGVLHEYGNIKMNYLSALAYMEDFPEGSNFGLVSPLSFVVSVRMILEAVYFKNTLYVIPYSTVKNFDRLRAFYIRKGIEMTLVPPSLYSALGGDFGGLMKCVLVGAEPANGIFSTEAKLFNLFGMSETLFSPYAFRIDRYYDKTPIGKPMPDISHMLLDEEGNEATNGKTGEICFYNPYFRGYKNLPELNGKVLEGGLFHTGDMAFEAEDGNLVFCGRADYMIKINGNRIEPAEIEAAYKKAVGDVWCAARGFSELNRAYICLYVLEEPGRSEEEIFDIMRRLLPYYMIPSHIIIIDEVPLNANGKLDRGALKAPAVDNRAGDYLPPENELERRICAAFEKALGREKIGTSDDFFKCGGDSIAALKAVTELNDDSVTAVDIYRMRTAGRLAELCISKNNICNISADEKEIYARTLELPLTDFQLRMLEGNISEPKSTMTNLPLLFKMGEVASPEKLEEALNEVIDNSPLFRTVVFFNDDCELRQRIDKTPDVSVKVEEMSEAAFRTELQEINRPFHLFNHVLIKARIIKTEDNLYLFILAHHMMIDGYGYRALLNKLACALEGKSLMQDRFYSYLYDESIAVKTEEYAHAKALLDGRYSGTDWYYTFEPDYVTYNHAGGSFIVNTGACEDDLKDMEKASGLTRNGLSLALILTVMNKYSHNPNVTAFWGYHNRDDESSRNTVGMRQRGPSAAVSFDTVRTLDDLYKAVNREIQSGISNSVYELGIKNFIEKGQDSLLMIYEGDLFDWEPVTRIGAVPEAVPNNSHNTKYPTKPSHFMVQGIETPGGLIFGVSYMKEAYREENIKIIEQLFNDISGVIFSRVNPGDILLENL